MASSKLGLFGFLLIIASVLFTEFKDVSAVHPFGSTEQCIALPVNISFHQNMFKHDHYCRVIGVVIMFWTLINYIAGCLLCSFAKSLPAVYGSVRANYIYSSVQYTYRFCRGLCGEQELETITYRGQRIKRFSYLNFTHLFPKLTKEMKPPVRVNRQRKTETKRNC